MNTTQPPSVTAVFLSLEGKAGPDKNASKSCRSIYLTDHLGSTRAVVDNSGTVLETFDYYPFGLLMPKRNTTIAAKSTNGSASGDRLIGKGPVVNQVNSIIHNAIDQGASDIHVRGIIRVVPIR